MKPLEGIHILDLGWVVAGPHATRVLSDLGASVIRFETAKHPDTLRPDMPRKGVTDIAQEGGWQFQEQNRNKLNINVNVKTPGGRRIFEALLKKSDIVCCNQAPRSFRKLGLDYEGLKAIKPDIIVANASGLGDYGKHSGYATYGPILNAICGISGLISYENEASFGYDCVIADYVGGLSLANALLAALEYRDRTGEGQFVDLAQCEQFISCFGELLLEREVTGVDPLPVGNHDYARRMAPHNVYQCRGIDRWVSIACGDDAEWSRLAMCIGQPWAMDSKYATLAGRLENQARLDAEIGRWARSRSPIEITYLLQSAHVSAAPVLNTEETLEDMNLLANKAFQRVEFAPSERKPDSLQVTGLLTPITGAELHVQAPASVLGGDTSFVLRQVLGMADAEIAQAETDGAFSG